MNVRLTLVVVASLAAGLGVVLGNPAPAVADCKLVRVTKIINDDVVTTVRRVCTPDGVAGVGDGQGRSDPTPRLGLGNCVAESLKLGLDPSEVCDGEDPDQPPQITPQTVAQVWRRIDLPPSRLVIEPPKGTTLVNFDTNFYTEPAQIQRTLRIFGRAVHFRIWADHYTWRFGDGESVRTTSPGTPYPDLEVTHSYLLTGSYRPQVDTTYVAEFRVGGGPWQQVPGSATIPGAPVDLRAIEARPTLVG